MDIVVFDYFRDNFLDGPDSPIYLACEYCAMLDIYDLLSFPDVDTLDYIPTPGPNTQPGPPQTLQLGCRNKLRSFIKWCRQVVKDNNGVFPNESEWLLFHPSDFEEFRFASASSNTAGTTTLSSHRGKRQAPPYDVMDFKKSIKPASYPILNDQKKSLRRSWLSVRAMSRDVLEQFNIWKGQPVDQS